MKLKIFLFLLISSIFSAQNIGDYQAVANGNWTANNVWQVYTTTGWKTISNTTSGYTDMGITYYYPGKTSPTGSPPTVTILPTVTVTGQAGPYTIGNLIVRGELDISTANNVDVNINTPNLILENTGSGLKGTLNFVTNSGLILAANTKIMMRGTNTGTNFIQPPITASGCNASKTITIGGTVFSQCNDTAAGAPYGFSELSGLAITASASYTSTNCTNTNITLTGSSTGSYTSSWSGSGPGGYTYGPSSTNPATLNLTAIGIYTFTYTATSTTTSTVTDSKTITVEVKNDSDNDGVCDDVDLDDDNDGVLDCIEAGLDDVANSFKMNGSAVRAASNEIWLTPALNNQAGQGWSMGKIDFAQDFTLDLDANFGTNTGGADGIAITFQNSPAGPAAVGNPGQGLGSVSIQNGITLALDSYQNTGEPSDHYGQIWKSVDGTQLTTAVSTSFGFKNNGWLPVKVMWNAATKTISYWISDSAGNNTTLLGTYTDSTLSFLGGGTTAYFGFTSSTGGANNEQRVRLKNMCTMPIKLDTDGDGIPNRLDLDSDGDTCPDAREAGVTLLSGVTVSSSGVVSGPYGANGFADSVETVAESGVYKGVYTYKYAVDKGSNLCIDADGDGYGDLIDLDDDNDGILDTDENNCAIAGRNILPGTGFGETNNFAYTTTADATSTNNSTNWTAAWEGTFTESGDVNFNWDAGVNGASFPNRPVLAIAADQKARLDALQNIILKNKSTMNIVNGYPYTFNVQQAKVDVNTTVGVAFSWVLLDSTGNIVQTLGSYQTRNGLQTGATTITTYTGALAPTYSMSFTSNLPTGNYTLAMTWVPSNNATNQADDVAIDDIMFLKACDTDNDNLPNVFDLDSDNDGCPDALEGGANLAYNNLTASVGTLKGGNGQDPFVTGLSGYNASVLLNLGITVGNTATTMGVPTVAGTGQTIGSALNSAVKATACSVCYNDPSTQATPAIPSKHGVTLLKRAGSENGNWPMIRQSGHTVLESNSKGFVITRIAKANLGNIGTPVVGMMVYDTTDQCLKIYTGPAATEGWKCFSTPACPD